MKCEFCELARDCLDPAQDFGGCDIDGVDDFGCGFFEDEEDDLDQDEDDWDY